MTIVNFYIITKQILIEILKMTLIVEMINLL